VLVAVGCARGTELENTGAAVFHVNKYTWCSQKAGGFPKDTLCCRSLWGMEGLMGSSRSVLVSA